jgi:hypothetical protein
VPTTTTAPALTVQEILLGAAAHIETYGWCQEDYFPQQWHGKGAREVPCCADAAICITAGMNVTDIYNDARSDLAKDAEELVVEHLRRLDAIPDVAGGLFAGIIGHWNDQDGMTAEEVAEILRDVAELAR